MSPSVVPSHLRPPDLLNEYFPILPSANNSRTIPSTILCVQLSKVLGASGSALIRCKMASAPDCCVNALPSRSHVAIQANKASFFISRLLPECSLDMSSDLSSSSPEYISRTKCLMSRLAGPFDLTTAPSKHLFLWYSIPKS